MPLTFQLNPDFQRKLVRLANRDGFNSTEVTALLEYAEHMQALTQPYDTDTSAQALIEVWKESFDAEPQG